MTKNIHPFPLRTPQALWTRILKEKGFSSINIWIGAAIMNFLTLTEAQRNVVLRDYISMTESKKGLQS